MNERIEFEIERITETKEARQVSMKRVGARTAWFASMQLDVPVEQSISIGDKVFLTVEWPA